MVIFDTFFLMGLNLVLYIVLCQGENENIPVLDSDVQSTMYKFRLEFTITSNSKRALQG